MVNQYQDKYRIASSRLQSWDYGWNASYFVTICTHNRIKYFGNIINGKMFLLEIGKIAYKYWTDIPEHFPFVKLGEFVIMPNHVHGIIIINKHNVETQNVASEPEMHNTETQNVASEPEMHNTETQNVASEPEMHNTETQNVASLRQNDFGPQSNNLASIIRGYKSGVKKYATMNNIDFSWQPRFHDHIIRNDKSYNRIMEYIEMNPLKWDQDKFNENQQL